MNVGVGTKMEDISMKKSVIERKLQQDDQNLERLRGDLKRSHELAVEICNILDFFNERLRKLEDTIRPIHDETTRLKRRQENVERTLNSINNVIRFHSLPEEVEEEILLSEKIDICGNPGNVEKYLGIMDKLKSAIDFFAKFNITSVESSTAKTLYTRGLDALARTFTNQLKRHSTDPVPLALLMDTVNNPITEEPPPLGHLQERLMHELHIIAEYLIFASTKKDFLSDYDQIRSNHVWKSVNQLKDSPFFGDFSPAHQTQRRGSLAQLLKIESPAKPKVTKKDKLIKGVTKSASGFALFKGEGQDEELEGCNLFLAMTSVLAHLIQSEHSLLVAIIPREHHSDVFDRLTTTSFERYIRRGEELQQRAKREIAKQSYGVILPLCKTVGVMKSHQHIYEKLMAELPSRLYNKYPVLLASFESLNSKALRDFCNFVKTDQERQNQLMPKDGTVHEFTSNVMSFLEQLLDYEETVGWCLASTPQLGAGRLPSVSEAEQRKALGKFLRAATDDLVANLQGKSKNYDSPTLQDLFLLNNYHFIHSVFQRNQRMLALLELDDSGVENTFIRQIEEQIGCYHRGFNRLLGFISMDTSMSLLPQVDKLTKSQRHAIKDKFKGFNEELDQLTRTQRCYAIPDEVLCQRMRQENCDQILPKYQKFYDAFSTVNFTEHYEKYVLYDNESLKAKLNTFFDSTA